MDKQKVLLIFGNFFFFTAFLACAILAFFNSEIKACGYMLNYYCFIMFAQFSLTFALGLLVCLEIKKEFFQKLIIFNFALSWAYLTFGAMLLLKISISQGLENMSIWLYIILWVIVGPPAVAFIVALTFCSFGVCCILWSMVKQKQLMINIDKLYDKLYGMSDKKIKNFIKKNEGEIDKFGLTPKEEDIMLDKFTLVCRV